MCIIAAKKRGLALPKDIDSIITSCFHSNPGGAGWMLKKSGEKTISYKKGFMTLQSFLTSFKTLDVKPDDEFVMHFRIPTHGSRGPDMTHPFMAVTEPKLLTTLTASNIKVMTFCHNGWINAVDRDPVLSDTAMFAKDYLSGYYKQRGKRKLKKWRSKIRSLIRGQRLAILHPGEEEMELLGDFIYDNGMFYSNSGYSYYRRTIHGASSPRNLELDYNDIEGECYAGMCAD